MDPEECHALLLGTASGLLMRHHLVYMVGGGAAASWWPGRWIVVAGDLGERDKLVLVAAGGLGRRSIRTM
jgi:hypothetical protein